MKAVILFSGGLDSTTLLYLVLGEGWEALPVFFSYGQRHAREALAARRLSAGLGLTLREWPVRMPGRKSLLVGDSGSLPGGLDDGPGRRIPATYVPGRNLVFLSLALSLAEDEDAGAVFIGANSVDYSGYPDCRPEFFRNLNALVAIGTRAGIEGRPIEVRAPLQALGKAEIIRLGTQLGVPFAETWSCYAGLDRPCGNCESCLLRARGFREAGSDDPAGVA